MRDKYPEIFKLLDKMDAYELMEFILYLEETYKPLEKVKDEI